MRFKSQAEEMGVYDHIHLFNPNDLNDDFKKYVLSLIKKGKKRGYGHWVWQTYIHQVVLSKIIPALNFAPQKIIFLFILFDYI